MDLADSIAALARSLEADARIATAILYGSAATGRARPSSDLDIGLIARSPHDAGELEAGLLDLASRLTLASGREVQPVLLERAEPMLGRQAFLNGRVLFDRNPRRTAQVLERILTEYFDGEYHRRLRAEALREHEAPRG